MRTASEKLRNRSSFSANVVYTTPGMHRSIGRLLEALQMELEMADLDFFTLKYKQAEREHKVGGRGPGSHSPHLSPGGVIPGSRVPLRGPCVCPGSCSH